MDEQEIHEPVSDQPESAIVDTPPDAPEEVESPKE